ncbi:hypothetical protein V8G54_028362 [Vigna mungo]|uniref:Uncharacterized protein n=1 Tax=Vigna mungo TaxID=3915 RepID=A0AAQ3MSA1_VIGMU
MMQRVRQRILFLLCIFGVREAYLLSSNALAFVRGWEMKAISQAIVSAFTISHRQDRHREQPCHLYSRAKRVTTQSPFFEPQAASPKPSPRVLPSSRNAISNEQLHLCHDTEAIQNPEQCAFSLLLFKPSSFVVITKVA